MVKHSPHTRWKGCPVCKRDKHRGGGQAARTPWPALRKLGRKRRITRRSLGD